MEEHLRRLSGLAGDVTRGAECAISQSPSDTIRLNWLLDLIRDQGTDGVGRLQWTNPADADPLEEDDWILDRAAIDRAMLKERRAA